MPDLYQTTLNLSSPMLHLSGVTPPALAEQTVRQSQPPGFGLPGISMQDLPGFSGILPGTYDVYRRISAHPTIALVMGMVKAPIAGNSWKWTKRDAQVKDEWVQFVQTTMDPLRGAIVQDALHALEYGWAPFEKIWEKRNGYKILARLKPLNWDFTQVLIDDHGNVCGLINQPPGKPKTELLDGKYFIYCIDSEAGNPYGRSRHENVRKEWCEAEQIRQRMAQYMRKVAGIVVQLHYPEGTSKDPAGADRPNQWLAQEVLDAVSQGKSVMFPNGFADTTDIRMAYELAGKSQWNLSSFDPGHGDYAPGMKTILEYYDALLFRGWLRPERSGLESKHGSRADAQVHTDTGTLDCELIDRNLAEAVNRGIVDDLLILNFGEEAKGAVYAQAAPIENDSVDIYKTLVNTLLASKETGSAVAKKIDIDGILDALNVPVEAKQRGALADEIQAETPQGSNGPAPAGQVLPLAGYDPNQARDKDGKWTSEGGGAATTPDARKISGTNGILESASDKGANTGEAGFDSQTIQPIYADVAPSGNQPASNGPGDKNSTPTPSKIQKYTNPAVAEVQKSLDLRTKRLATLQKQQQDAQNQGISVSKALLADIADNQQKIAALQDRLKVEIQRESDWNKFDDTIVKVVDEYNKAYFAKYAAKSPKGTTPLDPSLVKALIFSETEMGTGVDYESLIAEGQEQYNDYVQKHDAWLKGNRVGVEPKPPDWLYQLNIGRVTDGNKYNEAIKDFNITAPTLAEEFAKGSESDIRLAVAVLLIKLQEASKALGKNRNLDAKDDMWFNAIVAYKGASAKGRENAELVWDLYTEGTHPYTPGKSLWK